MIDRQAPSRGTDAAAVADRPAQDPLSATRAQAIALAYHDGDAAPRVVAKGNGLLAEEIIRRAREAGVFVHESRELVSVLAKLDLDSQIPPQLYTAIAEILAWVYRVEQRSVAAALAPGPARTPPAALPGRTSNPTTGQAGKRA